MTAIAVRERNESLTTALQTHQGQCRGAGRAPGRNRGADHGEAAVPLHPQGVPQWSRDPLQPLEDPVPEQVDV